MPTVYTSCKPEVLCDTKKDKYGREKAQPWRPKKVRNLQLADVMATIPGLEKRAERCRMCGTFLSFRENIATKEKRLDSANFCRDRLCPMCAWRRSIKLWHQLSQIMNEIENQYPNLVPIFVTLTVQNCESSSLIETLDMMFNAWKKLLQRATIKRQIVGWFRALEITHSKKDATWHPHFHGIMLVDKSYFKKSNSEYLKTEDWVQLWRQSLKVDYDPVCDARRVKGNRKKAVSETAKYTVKDTDYILREDVEETKNRVEIIANALRGRRLVAFGGIMKETAAKLKLDDVEDGDLIVTGAAEDTSIEEIDNGDGTFTFVDTQSGEIREDLAEVRVYYRWDFNTANFIRER